MKKTGLALAILLFTVTAFAGGNKKDDADLINATKVSRPGVYEGYTKPQYKGFNYQSYYVPMRDSVLLAVDVFLPKNLEKGKKIPTILYPTRYSRSIQAKFPLNIFRDPILVIVSEAEINFFTSYGYACVIVDARGSGASMGQRNMEFSPAEVEDGNDVINWIVKQTWCNGNLATSGISYGATMAEMLLANQNPAVKACIPRSGIFDLYNDIMFPGGVCQGPFVDVWGLTTKSLDDNNYAIFGKQAKLVTGIHPVKGDKHKVVLNQAIKSHKKNFDVFAGLKTIKFRDDYSPSLKAAADDFSNSAQIQKIENSGTAIYRIGGWYDGALAKSCTDGYLNTSNTQKVLLGPWDHGPHLNVSPYAETKELNFSIYTEMLRFLDYHLKGIDNGIENEPAIIYYTVGEEAWKTSNTWPLKNQKQLNLYLSADKSMQPTPSATQAGSIDYKVDYTATSGNTSRWNSVTALYMHGPTNYADRGEEDKKLLSFTAAPLTETTEITGHPVVNLQYSANATDGTVFCYLEDVGPDGSVTYVTEGMLKVTARKLNDDVVYKTAYPDHSFRQADDEKYKKGDTVTLAFDLLPISYQFKKGHSIRVSIAGADAGHFDLPEHTPDNIIIACGLPEASFLQLPVNEK
jgi:putative CocE/NonD family hydrolase